jgi:hypothetical protein
MPRQVKCQDTGWLTTSDKAYKAPNKKYYSSQAAYEKIHERNEWRRKCIDELSTIVFGDAKLVIPSMAMKLLNNFDDYHALHMTIVEQRDQIRTIVATKAFSSDYGRFKYIFAILENHYNDNLIASTAKKNENTADITMDEVSIAGKRGGSSHSVASLVGDL